VILSATGRVRSYDLESGALIWQCGGLSRNVVATPVAADGWVYVGNSYDARAMLAIRLDKAKGDITGTDAVAWSIDRHTPYVPSPLLWRGRLCFLKHSQGFLSCLQAKTGKLIFGPLRLQGIGTVFASPLAAAGRIYITGREGNTMVLSGGEEPEVLALNALQDVFAASPVAVGHELYLRGERFLYRLAAKEENKVPAGPK
jgi:outer membrane protein assembly factor BamB